MEASRLTEKFADSRTDKAQAKRIVKAYVLKRRVQKKCIVDLAALRRTSRMTAGDRVVVNEHFQRLTIFWWQQAEYEIEILSKWFDPELPTDDTKLPPRL